MKNHTLSYRVIQIKPYYDLLLKAPEHYLYNLLSCYTFTIIVAFQVNQTAEG